MQNYFIEKIFFKNFEKKMNTCLIVQDFVDKIHSRVVKIDRNFKILIDEKWSKTRMNRK